MVLTKSLIYLHLFLEPRASWCIDLNNDIVEARMDQYRSVVAAAQNLPWAWYFMSNNRIHIAYALDT
jgi:hypothetical protein